MKILTTAAVLLLAAASFQVALAASFEPPTRAADSAATPGLGLDPSGGGVLKIPPTTFT